jgi:hypothetical protein
MFRFLLKSNYQEEVLIYFYFGDGTIGCIAGILQILAVKISTIQTLSAWRCHPKTGLT